MGARIKRFAYVCVAVLVFVELSDLVHSIVVTGKDWMLHRVGCQLETDSDCALIEKGKNIFIASWWVVSLVFIALYACFGCLFSLILPKYYARDDDVANEKYGRWLIIYVFMKKLEDLKIWKRTAYVSVILFMFMHLMKKLTVVTDGFWDMDIVMQNTTSSEYYKNVQNKYGDRFGTLLVISLLAIAFTLLYVFLAYITDRLKKSQTGHVPEPPKITKWDSDFERRLMGYIRVCFDDWSVKKMPVPQRKYVENATIVKDVVDEMGKKEKEIEIELPDTKDLPMQYVYVRRDKEREEQLRRFRATPIQTDDIQTDEMMEDVLLTASGAEEEEGEKNGNGETNGEVNGDIKL